MALVATPGAPDANSYVTVAEADAYFGDRSYADAWPTLTNKEQMLITSTSIIDWYITWKGSRASDTQALDWPRDGVYDEYGTLYPNDVIPKPVKVAVYELTLSSLDADRVADNPLDGIDEVRAGSLLLKADNGLYTTRRDAIPEKIWKILANLTTRSGIGVVRLMRA